MDTKELKPIGIKANDAVEAVFSDATQMHYYLDLESGEILPLLDPDGLFDIEDPVSELIDEDPDRYEQIDPIEGRQEYRLMSRFADSIDESDIQRQLRSALEGRGAFRRFKDVVWRYPDIQARWLNARADYAFAEVEAWLAGRGLRPEWVGWQPNVADSEPARPAPAKRPKHPNFVQLLLLGGSNALVDGCIVRTYAPGHPQDARAAFKRIARDLYEHFGIAWRNRFIQGVQSVTVEGVVLQHDDEKVEMRVPVPQEIWECFQK